MYSVSNISLKEQPSIDADSWQLVATSRTLHFCASYNEGYSDIYLCYCNNDDCISTNPVTLM